MSKNHRGKGLIEKYRKGRGTCPVCNRTGVKVTHEKEVREKKVEICKICVATLSRKETMLKKQASAAETKEKVGTVTEKSRDSAEETSTDEG